MKKFRFPLVALALLLGVGAAFSAGAVSHSAARAGEEWFIYDGSGNVNDQDSYSLFTQDPQNGPSCTIGSELCAIQAQPDPAHPNRPALSTKTAEKDKN